MSPPKPLRISEDTWLNLKAGGLFALAVGLCTATVWIYQTKNDAAQALAEIREWRSKMEPVVDQHKIMWHEFEKATAGRSAPVLVGP